MLIVVQLFVALMQQCDCHPIPPQPSSSIKTNDCAVAVLGFAAKCLLYGTVNAIVNLISIIAYFHA